ncbi:MAG TPA: hypothetical protein VIA18_00635 [Polyangia bacterium]|nr:hypothetical protein [Polyangia bacterium]
MSATDNGATAVAIGVDSRAHAAKPRSATTAAQRRTNIDSPKQKQKREAGT